MKKFFSRHIFRQALLSLFLATSLFAEDLSELVQEKFLSPDQAGVLNQIKVHPDNPAAATFSIGAVEFEFSSQQAVSKEFYPGSFSAFQSLLQACFYASEDGISLIPRSGREIASLVNFFMTFYFKNTSSGQAFLGGQFLPKKDEVGTLLGFLGQCEKANFGPLHFYAMIKKFADMKLYERVYIANSYCSTFGLGANRKLMLSKQLDAVLVGAATFASEALPAFLIVRDGFVQGKALSHDLLVRFLNGGEPLYLVCEVSGLPTEQFFGFKHSFVLGLFVENHFGSKTLRVMVYYPFKEVSREVVKIKALEVLANFFSLKPAVGVPRTEYFSGALSPVASVVNASDLKQLTGPLTGPLPVKVKKAVRPVKLVNQSMAKRFVGLSLLAAAKRRAAAKAKLGQAKDKAKNPVRQAASGGAGPTLTSGGKVLEAKIQGSVKGVKTDSVDSARGLRDHGWAELDEAAFESIQAVQAPGVGVTRRKALAVGQAKQAGEAIKQALANRKKGQSVEQVLDEACKRLGLESSSEGALKEALGEALADQVEDVIEQAIVAEEQGLPEVGGATNADSQSGESSSLPEGAVPGGPATDLSIGDPLSGEVMPEVGVEGGAGVDLGLLPEAVVAAELAKDAVRQGGQGVVEAVQQDAQAILSEVPSAQDRPATQPERPLRGAALIDLDEDEEPASGVRSVVTSGQQASEPSTTAQATSSPTNKSMFSRGVGFVKQVGVRAAQAAKKMVYGASE